MKAIKFGTTETGEEMIVDLEKEGIRFILLVGASASGKSIFHTHLYREIASKHTPEEVGFILLDMTIVDSIGCSPEYMVMPPVTKPDEALSVLENLKSGQRALVVHIEECDMVYRDRERFEKGIEQVLQENKNIYIVYSTSRIDTGYLGDWMKKYVDLKVVFRVAREEDSTFLLGNSAAYHFKNPGEHILAFNDKQIKCVPFLDTKAYTEYQKYQNAGEWWEKEGRGKFPLQVPMAISKLQKEKNLSFQEAFEELVDRGAIVFAQQNGETAPSSSPKTLLLPLSLTAEEALDAVKKHLKTGGMNIYLDIRGVLLKKNGELFKNAEPFLSFITQKFQVYWLPQNLESFPQELELLKSKVSENLLPALDKIVLAKWEVDRMEGINFQKQIIWLPASITEEERKKLREHNRLTDVYNVLGRVGVETIGNNPSYFQEIDVPVWKSLNLLLTYTGEQVEMLRKGFDKGRNMDYRWHIYMENDWLYLERSWTDFVAYKIHFSLKDGMYVVDEAYTGLSSEEGSATVTENTYHQNMVEEILKSHIFHPDNL